MRRFVCQLVTANDVECWLVMSRGGHDTRYLHGPGPSVRDVTALKLDLCFSATFP